MATNQTTQITVLNDLPRFAGRPKPGEAPFKNEVDARTFLRTVENFFIANGITSDERKIQIVYSLIDKKKGTALSIVSCYVSRKVSFERFKKEFLGYFPSLRITEFKHAAEALTQIKLPTENMTCDITNMEALSRATVETYLKNQKLTNNKFNELSELPVFVENDDDEENDELAIPVIDLLQNFLLHVLMASQLDYKIYEKVQDMGPDNPSTGLISDTVKAQEAYNQKKGTKSKIKNEVIWKVDNNKPNFAKNPKALQTHNPPQVHNPPQAQHFSKNPHKPPAYKYAQKPTDSKGLGKPSCYSCGSERHFKNDCYRCHDCGTIRSDPSHPSKREMRCCVCLKTNHRAETCRLLRNPAPGKYCHYCKVPYSHTYAECRRKNYAKHHANLIRDENDTNQNDPSSDDWGYWDDEPKYEWFKPEPEQDSSSHDDQTSSEDDQ